MEYITYLIAFITIYIAIQQYRINKDKYKFELFDKRYKVYLAVVELIHFIIAHDDLTSAQIIIYDENTSQSVFLFGSEINNYIDEIRKNAVEFEYSRNHISEPIEKEKYQKLIRWFVEQRKIVALKFSKDLKLKR